MEGEVPTPWGKIRVKVNGEEITIYSDGGEGTLMIGDKKVSIPAGKTVTHTVFRQ